MEINRLSQAALTVARITTRLGPLLDADTLQNLQDACDLMAEVRHFAVCYQDLSQAEKAQQMTAEQVRRERNNATHRLVQTIRPD